MGVGFNPCHLSLPTDLKLAHWTAVAHAHRTVKHKHLIYSLVDRLQIPLQLSSHLRSWLWTTRQLKGTPASQILPRIGFFQHFHAASFPDGGLPRPESVTVKVVFSHGLNEALLHTLKPLR